MAFIQWNTREESQRSSTMLCYFLPFMLPSPNISYSWISKSPSRILHIDDCSFKVPDLPIFSLWMQCANKGSPDWNVPAFLMQIYQSLIIQMIEGSARPRLHRRMPGELYDPAQSPFDLYHPVSFLPAIIVIFHRKQLGITLSRIKQVCRHR